MFSEFNQHLIKIMVFSMLFSTHTYELYLAIFVSCYSSWQLEGPVSGANESKLALTAFFVCMFGKEEGQEENSLDIC